MITRQFMELENIFGNYEIFIKKFEENKTFDTLEAQKIFFNTSNLALPDLTDLNKILQEQACVSRLLFVYGAMFENQSHTVQMLEDEFNMWEAAKMQPLLIDKRFKSETAKTAFLKVEHEDEYKSYYNRLREERYKLGLIKRTVTSLENFSFKLDAIQRGLETALKKLS